MDTGAIPPVTPVVHTVVKDHTIQKVHKVPEGHKVTEITYTVTTYDRNGKLHTVTTNNIFIELDLFENLKTIK